MSVFFGTDGLRGVVGQDLTYDLAFKCGNSLSQMIKGKAKVLIGRDTRVTGDYLVSSIATGLMAGGVDVYYLGVIPTSGVAFLTETYGYDYGIVITASHNPNNFNGIKIFSNKGEKISEDKETLIERGFIKTKQVSFDKVGKFYNVKSLVKKYRDYLLSTVNVDLSGISVVVDASNGAGYNIAPYLFRKLGAKVYTVGCKNDGININVNCGSLHTERLMKKVVKVKADFGVAFDGDADRLIAVDSLGNIVDGDSIVMGLALYFKSCGQLKNNIVVGTSQTNMGIENELKEKGIKLIRADVGDKYVISQMNKFDAILGGEQSGHVILRQYMKTGDGILTAIQLICACIKTKRSLSSFCYSKLYPQINVNVEVKDKLRTLGNEQVSIAIANAGQELAGEGRVLVRASGTEPKIRIMVEGTNIKVCEGLAEYIKRVILSVEDGV